MGQRLLIVDSDRRFLAEHKVGLESAFDVDFAGGTDGVAQRLEAGDHAAVLICVEVSDNKGYALCSAIRKNPALAGVKVALISGKATEEEYARHQSLKGRADLYLHKPIAPGALVSALGALVPPKALNPDNPFGELGEDLGEEWLESLKPDFGTPEPSELPPLPEVPEEPVRTAPLAPSLSTLALPPLLLPRIEAPAQDAGRVELLEARVQDLETKLQDMGELLAGKDRELEELRHAHEAATVNLDEAERLRIQIQETEEALVGQERALAAAQGQLDENAEELRQAKAFRETQEGLLAERDRELEEARSAREALAAELEGLKGSAGRVPGLEEALAERSRGLEEVQGRLSACEQRLAEQESLRLEREGRVQELEAALAERGRSDAELASLREETEAREARIRELEAQVEGLRGEIDVHRVDIHGLEATLRGQRRELAEQGSRMGALTRECEAQQERIQAAEALVQEREAALAEREAALAASEEAHARTRTQLEGTCAELERQMARTVSEFESQKMELLHGIDEREAQLGRLGGNLEASQERVAQLEREKRELEGQLNEKAARLESLGQALQDLEQGLRRASDLTRPF